MTLELEKSQNIALRGRRGYGSARSRYEAYEMGYQDDQGMFPCANHSKTSHYDVTHGDL